MDRERLTQIRRVAVIALFSDDDLMERLVLKGGNALDIVYKDLSTRASVDLDFSLEDDFEQSELPAIENKIRTALENAFREEGYVVFDVKFSPRPRRSDPKLADFWGGYRIEFKIIDEEIFRKLGKSIISLRRNATVIGENQKRVFKIDISKYEHCHPKREDEIDGLMIFVYTPEMIVFEKLRAICQQMPEYLLLIGRSNASPRARDFYDIHGLIKRFKINLTSLENLGLLKNIFDAKKVPINLLSRVQDYKEYHRGDFPSVVDTVDPQVKLESFDFYFEYAAEKCQELLKSLGEI